MTILFFCACAGGRLGAGLALGQSTEPAELEGIHQALAWAKVTIPYVEWKSLWETARTQATGLGAEAGLNPPVDALLVAADYELVLDKAVLNAQYQVRSLTDDWHLIPLLGGEARLEQVETSQTAVLWQDGHYCFLARGEGEFSVKLRFVVPGPASWTREDGLKLRLGAAALNRLRVSGLPDGQTVQAQGLAPTELGPGIVTYHLSGQGGEVVLSLESDTPPAPPLPSTWNVQSEVLARYQEGRVLYACRVYAQANDGSGLSLDLWLPQNAQSVVHSGADLADARLGPRQNGQRPLHLRWNTRDVLDRKLEISYELAQSPLSTEWTLHAPRVLGQDKTQTLFVIPAVDGLELTGQDLKDSVQSRRLPEWLREKIGPGDFLTTEAGAEYVLRATWLPRVETAQAIVSLAEYDTRLVADGALLVQAQYTVAHASPLNWRLDLPAVDEILSCQINGKPIQPVKRGENQIELSLASAAQGTTKVAFSYASRLEALDPVSGRIAISLPQTDLFVHALKWMLTIPAVYETTAVEGNVAIDDSPADSPTPARESRNIIRLKKELLRAQHPAAEIYYQRHGIND